jgi:hypothetical protein
MRRWLPRSSASRSIATCFTCRARISANALHEAAGQRLVDLIADADAHLVHAARRLAPDGLKAWAQVLERGYEGLVAKDEASRYVGGPHARLAQGEAGELDRGRAPVAADDGRHGAVARRYDSASTFGVAAGELERIRRRWRKPWQHNCLVALSVALPSMSETPSYSGSMAASSMLSARRSSALCAVTS